MLSGLQCELAGYLVGCPRGWKRLRVNGSHHVYAKPGVNVRRSIPQHGSHKLKVGSHRHLIKLAVFNLNRDIWYAPAKELEQDE